MLERNSEPCLKRTQTSLRSARKVKRLGTFTHGCRRSVLHPLPLFFQRASERRSETNHHAHERHCGTAWQPHSSYWKVGVAKKMWQLSGPPLTEPTPSRGWGYVPMKEQRRLVTLCAFKQQTSLNALHFNWSCALFFFLKAISYHLLPFSFFLTM